MAPSLFALCSIFTNVSFRKLKIMKTKIKKKLEKTFAVNRQFQAEAEAASRSSKQKQTKILII